MKEGLIGILLVIAGFLILCIAFSWIPGIPRQAREVYRETMQQPDSVTGDKSWFTNHREWYCDAHLKGMYLQNIYVASAGLVLALGGLFFLSSCMNKKPNASTAPADIPDDFCPDCGAGGVDIRKEGKCPNCGYQVG
jgi:hypothetical protein